MAPPSLPTEILAHILELMCEPIDYDQHTPVPYSDLLNCTRTSKDLGLLAAQQLYHRLEIKVGLDERGSASSRSTALENALLRYQRLGTATRSVEIFCCVRQEDAQAKEASATARRALGICLVRCPNLTLVDIGGMLMPDLHRTLEHLGEERPHLRRLILSASHEDAAMPASELAAGLSKVPDVRGLMVNISVAATGTDSAQLKLGALSGLSHLQLGDASYHALRLLAPSASSSLRQLSLDLTLDWDPLHVHACLPSFVRLSSLELFLPDLDTLERILPSLNLCSNLRRLWPIVTPLPTGSEASAFAHLDLTRLPSSIIEYNFDTTGIPFLPFLRLFNHGLDSDAVFFIYPDHTHWCEEEKEQWREVQEGDDGRDGDDSGDEDGT